MNEWIIVYKATELAKEDNKNPKTIRSSKKYITVLVKKSNKTVQKEKTKRYIRTSDVIDYLRQKSIQF